MIAQVIVDISNDAVDRVFDYIALEDTQIGMRVKVPFAGRYVLGYVISLNETSQKIWKKHQNCCQRYWTYVSLCLGTFFCVYPTVFDWRCRLA